MRGAGLGHHEQVGEGMQIHLGARRVFAAGGADLTVRGVERIAPTGPNAAGKTTLMCLNTGELASEGG